ncbi:hypothetical protein ACIRF8_15945 [Streptomyces sp. NPDC102406]|uniref:hypothetical protein n=1 Tax=Streptomyces sp. NPDC102406 TaxID=3366171 RepID=UPI0037F5A036
MDDSGVANSTRSGIAGSFHSSAEFPAHSVSVHTLPVLCQYDIDSVRLPQQAYARSVPQFAAASSTSAWPLPSMPR